MSRQHHYLKCETQFYQAVEKGIKKFEIRKNDRHFEVGDMVYLQEVVSGQPTGRSLPAIEIKYLFLGGLYGLASDYCVFNW